MIPPLWLYLRIRGNHGPGFRIAFPLILIWILLSPLILLFFLIVAIAGLFLGVNGAALVRDLWKLFCAIRGTRIDVQSNQHIVKVVVL